MPIKPENKKRYPTNWKEIRAAILKRAQNKCEQCGLSNYSMVSRGLMGAIEFTEEGDFIEHDGELYSRKYSYSKKTLQSPFAPPTKVILTIAHLNPPVENCAMDNLKALCQKCHLQLDMPIHLKNRKETLLKKKEKGQMQLL